jgi:hypothetical protein
MSAEEALSMGWSGTIALAKVESADGASVRVSGPGFGRAAARLAVPAYAPRAGDAVLVALADDGSRYVVGVVRALRDSSDVPEAQASELRASDGAHARIEQDEEGREVLALRDAEGRLLVAHRPELGRTEICADGDLVLRAGGDLELDAQGAVRVRAGSDLRLEGRGDVVMASTDLDGEPRSALSMREGQASLSTERLGATIERADVTIRELNFVTRTLRTVAGRVKREVEVLETHAGRIVEHARESYRETEGLSQTRAGRLRMVAETSFTTLAEKVLLKAGEDVKIKGEKIYLA